MSNDPIEVLRRVLDDNHRHGHTTPDTLNAIESALASLSAPKPESAEASAPVGVEGRAREAVALALDEAGHHTEADNVRKGIDLDEYREALSIARNALAKQPTAAPVGVEELADAWEARAAKSHPSDAMLINKHVRELREALAQQPAAVDEAMVGRFCRRWYEITGRSLERVHVLASLDSALAVQQQGTPGGDR